MDSSLDNRDAPLDELSFGILGELEAHDGGRRFELGPVKQRIVLALLLCRANQVVPVAVLRDALWPDDPPRTAHKNLQGYVSTLRRVIGRDTGAGGRLRRHPPGYVIEIGSDQLDALAFQALARSGAAACRDGDTVAAANLLGRAVRMWRGPVLPDLASVPAVAAEAHRLRERYLTTYEDWAEARLALGQHAELVDALDELTRQHPFRERLRHAQMLALYRCGRQVEALAQYDGVRQMLARELGLPPSPVLTRLYESMLAGDRRLCAAEPDRRPSVTVREPPTGRHKLPRDLADFTGRSADVDAVLDIAGDPRRGGIIVLSGPAGAGKSALAVHCAHRVADRFPDGQVFVSLRAPDGTPRCATDVVDELRGWTTGPATLLILDDALTEEQVRPVLTASGDCAVVVTGRRHLAGLESVAHRALEPMPAAEALELLGRLAGGDRIAAEPRAAERLVAICGGLPLAVRIVGARLAGLRHLTLGRFADRLADDRRLLDELVAGDMRLRARLAAWYRDLGADDRRWAHTLAALPGPTFAAATAAAGLDSDVTHVEAAIERLIEAGLVEVPVADVRAHSEQGGACYAMAPPIRAFLREHGPTSAG
jgi:DNA-binding SARP family transcriptional activator